MLGWLLVTLGVAFGSALLPLISVEIFVVGLMASHPVPWLALAGAAAIGQVAGKLLYYLAVKGHIRLPAALHNQLHRERLPSPRRERWRAKTKWVHSKVDALREKCHRHPQWMHVTYGISSIVGLPPYMAMTILAGLARMSLSIFLTVGLAGRFIRYSALALSPALFFL